MVFKSIKIVETAVVIVVEVVDGIIGEAVDIKAISEVSVDANVEAIRDFCEDVSSLIVVVPEVEHLVVVYALALKTKIMAYSWQSN